MSVRSSLIAASLTAFAVVTGATPVLAQCKTMGFTVNDYGKDGPTKDAKDLLDKEIAKWAADNGVEKYTVGKKTVKCELFLDVILFDEHTCTASASVCWGASATPAPAKSAKKDSSSSKAASTSTAEKDDKPSPSTAAADDKPPVETGAIDKEAAAKEEQEEKPASAPAAAAVEPASEAAAKPDPGNDAAERAAAAAERAAAAAERAAAAAEKAAAGSGTTSTASSNDEGPPKP